ncbi:MAG: 50S ribosomal protein L32 [Candidatus Ancillula sp.]|jgi:large subunit ribosomal protein L32|nr:50S ribosomal protein L32 [Candidatus Ancillula sp.]
MLPKRRVSRANTRTRRAQWKAVEARLSLCPSCGADKRAHYACSKCGQYKGREYAQPE